MGGRIHFCLETCSQTFARVRMKRHEAPILEGKTPKGGSLIAIVRRFLVAGMRTLAFDRAHAEGSEDRMFMLRKSQEERQVPNGLLEQLWRPMCSTIPISVCGRRVTTWEVDTGGYWRRWTWGSPPQIAVSTGVRSTLPTVSIRFCLCRVSTRVTCSLMACGEFGTGDTGHRSPEMIHISAI